MFSALWATKSTRSSAVLLWDLLTDSFPQILDIANVGESNSILSLWRGNGQYQSPGNRDSSVTVFSGKIIAKGSDSLLKYPPSVFMWLGSLIGLAATAFNQAYAPWLLRKLNKNSYREKTRIVAFTYAYFLLIITASVAFGLISPFLIDFLVGKNFKESTLYVMWISLGFAFTGTYYMVVNYIFYAEKTYILAIVTLGGSLINCLLNYFFIKQRGPVGAAQATALSNFIIFVLVWFLSSKVYYMPWNPLNLIRYFKKERISAAGR